MTIELVVKDRQVKENYFEDFWEEYPRKVSKKMAKKAWEKIRPSLELTERIIQALYVQKKVWEDKETEPEFIPHASTWLNQERWEDEIEKPMTDREKILRALKEG